MRVPSYIFDIGTTFNRRRRRRVFRLETVTDILKTYNSKGELVSVRYVATHEFLGQTVTDSDVIHTTIVRGLIESKGWVLL